MVAKKICIASFLTFVWHLNFAMAQSTGSFIFPTRATGGNLPITINIVDTVVVQWTSNYDRAFLWLWCAESGKGFTKWMNRTVDTNGETTYEASMNKNLGTNWAAPYSCHFDLNYEDANSRGFNGAPMYITSVPDMTAKTHMLQRTTPSASLSKETPSNTIASLNSIIASPTSSSTISNSAPSSKSGLSTGAKAGIAVGVVAGLIALLALGFMLWRTKRKVDTLSSRLPPDHGHDYVKPQGVEVAPAYHEGNVRPYEMQTTAPVELGPYQPPQELHGSTVERTKH